MAIWQWRSWSSLVEVMACRLLGVQTLLEPVLNILCPQEPTSMLFKSKYNSQRKWIWKCFRRKHENVGLIELTGDAYTHVHVNTLYNIYNYFLNMFIYIHAYSYEWFWWLLSYKGKLIANKFSYKQISICVWFPQEIHQKELHAEKYQVFEYFSTTIVCHYSLNMRCT